MSDFFAICDTHHKTFNGGEKADKLSAYDNTHHNSFNGGKGEDELEAQENAHNNTFNGGEKADKLSAYDNTHHNSFNGGAGEDHLGAEDNAHHNTFNGGEGKDKLRAYSNVYYNVFNGGAGEDHLGAEDNAHHNTFNGSKGMDWLRAYNDAYHNIFNGGVGEDRLWADHSTHHNTFNGGEGGDHLKAEGNAYDNTFNGGEGTDVLLAYGNADSNTFNGGEDNDVIVSTRGGILQGEAGDDFILTYLPDGNFFSNNKPLIMTGGEGHDVLMGSGLFWQRGDTELEEEDSVSSWAFDAGVGDDIIMPYIALEKIGMYRALQNSINDFKQIIIYSPSDMIRNTRYHITTGDGQDIIALSSQSAENVTTHIKDFNWDEDKLAFDSEEMAGVILPQLALAKKLSTMLTVEFNYKGHQYIISDTQQSQKSVALQQTDVDDLNIQYSYPDFGEKIEISYDYKLYDAKDVAYKVKVNDLPQLNKGVFTKKTFSKTYTIKLEKNNFVTTKTTLNLIPNEKGILQVKLGAHLSDTVVSFRARDLFADENARTCVYQNLGRTDEALYFKTPERHDMPDTIVAVVVVQENSNGLVFTTQSEKEKVTASPTTQIFTASDFFGKGHFSEVGGHNDQQKSVTMKLGLVLKGKDNTLITTPLSDPIHVGVGKGKS